MSELYQHIVTCTKFGEKKIQAHKISIYASNNTKF